MTDEIMRAIRATLGRGDTVEIEYILEGHPRSDGDPQFVTLDHMAALVNRKKKTLERKIKDPANEAPAPDVNGGDNPHEWKWHRIRGWLEKHFNRQLPDRFPR